MRFWRRVRVGVGALTAVCVLGAIAPAAFAQTYQGAVRGSVKDNQGVIPGAELTLINEETNAVRTTQTNGSGEYAFPNILPGPYVIKVAMPGFKTEERKGLRIATQQQVQLDFTLEVGALSEEVLVTAEAPLIERATASRATTMTAEEINALPIFGRNTFYTSISTPNVVQTGDPLFVRYQDQSGSSLLSMGGGPRRGNAYLLEGVSLTDFSNRAAWVPSAESLSDMRVQVKTYDAEMGRAAGGAFNVTAKSGSNDFHGSALFLNKPGWGMSNLFYAERAGIPIPPQYYYNWAGSVGGPIARNRTFFWFSTDDYVQQSTRNIAPQFPTALERAGDFSQTFSSSGQLVVIYDPATTRTVNGQVIRDPFPGNKIPANRISPIALQYLQGIPVPTDGRGLQTSSILNDGPQNQETIKIDHRWSDRSTTTGMYGHQYTKEPGTANQGPFGTIASDSGGSLLERPVHFFAVNHIVVPNNSTTLTFRYGINNFGNTTSYPGAAGFEASSLGYPAYYTDPLSAGAFPSSTIDGYQGIGHGGTSASTHISQTWNGTMTRLVGSHSIKTGADYRQVTLQDFPATNGSFTYTKGYTQLNAQTVSTTAGDAMASFLLGLPSGASYTVNTAGEYTIDYVSAYVQDDYRISSKLSANFGLRYEHEPGVRAKGDEFITDFAFDDPFPIQVAGYDLKGGLMYAGVDGKTRMNLPLNGVAPRGGIAWSVTDKQVIRGGYGFFWVPTVGPSIPARGYSASSPFVASVDGGNTPIGVVANPFPAGISQPIGNSQGRVTGVGTDISFSDPNAKPGYVHQFSADWQKEFVGGNVISFGYMGSRSERLGLGSTSDTSLNINQLDPQYQALGAALNQSVPNPFFGIPEFAGTALGQSTTTRGQLLRPYPQYLNITMTRNNVAEARYHAVVTRWSKRMSHGYSADVSYTWSDTKDNQVGEGNGFSSAGGLLDNYNVDQEFGTSLQDLKHRLNVNFTYQLPFGDGRKWLNGGGISNALLGGWQVAMSGRYQSGFPMGMSQASNSGLLGSGQRPNVVPGAEVMTTGSQEDRAVNGWFNPDAFAVAPAFTFGNSPRVNPDWRGPGQRTTDLAISKFQRIADANLQFRLDVLNLLNDPLFNAPNTTIGNINFGKITSVGGFARSIQIQVRLAF